MAISYTPPGVTVTELSSPSVNPLLAAPASVCLVGEAQGFIQVSEAGVQLTGVDAVALGKFPRDNADLTNPVISVTKYLDTTVYTEGVDFQIGYSNQVAEVQTVTVANATGGSFTISFGTETTATIAYNASASAFQTALENLSNIDPGDVAVTLNSGVYTLTFAGQYQYTDVDQVVPHPSLSGSNPTITPHTVINGGVAGTIARKSGSAIPDGGSVVVVYQYKTKDYFVANSSDDQSAIEQQYGSAFNDDGTINSPLSFAASIAFENGATELVLQPLFRRTDDNDPASAKREPTVTEVADNITWFQTLYSLRDQEDINVIVPISGQSSAGVTDSIEYSIFREVQNHVNVMNANEQFLIAILGEDSSISNTVGQGDILRTHVDTLRSSSPVSAQELVLLSPSKYIRTNPKTTLSFSVGAQYAAAAIAGMLAARPVASSITRQFLAGFSAVGEVRSKADKNADAQKGLFVLEQRGNAVQVRHAITIDNSAIERRELPVVRAKHRVIESVRDTLEQGVIGQVIADGDAPVVVSSAVGGVLEQLVNLQDIVSYSDIQSRTLETDPTTVEVRFNYRPAFPLNYISISFTLDLTSGGVSVG